MIQAYFGLPNFVCLPCLFILLQLFQPALLGLCFSCWPPTPFWPPTPCWSLLFSLVLPLLFSPHFSFWLPTCFQLLVFFQTPSPSASTLIFKSPQGYEYASSVTNQHYLTLVCASILWLFLYPSWPETNSLPARHPTARFHAQANKQTPSVTPNPGRTPTAQLTLLMEVQN